MIWGINYLAMQPYLLAIIASHTYTHTVDQMSFTKQCDVMIPTLSQDLKQCL